VKKENQTEIEMYLQMVKKNNNQINNLSMDNDEFLNEIRSIIEIDGRKIGKVETTIIDSGMTVGDLIKEVN